MNNISVKNLKFSIKDTNVMPYGKADYVKLSRRRPSYPQDIDNQLNAVNVNNAFRQLLDNDLYLEKQLVGATAYVAGPKSNSVSAVAAGDDGYKCFGDASEQDVTIYRKINFPLSDTVGKVFPGEAYFVFEDEGYFYVGSASGVAYSRDLSSFGVIDADSLGEDVVNIRGYLREQGFILFVGDSGVYAYSKYDDGEIRHRLVRINKQDAVSGLKCAAFNQADGTLFVGSVDGVIWQAEVFASDIQNGVEPKSVDFIRCGITMTDGKPGTGEINSITAVKELTSNRQKAVFASTARGILQSGVGVHFNNEERIFTGDEVYALTDIGGKRYVGTSAGTYVDGEIVDTDSAGGPVSVKARDFRLFDESVICVHADGVFDVSGRTHLAFSSGIDLRWLSPAYFQADGVAVFFAASPSAIYTVVVDRNRHSARLNQVRSIYSALRVAFSGIPRAAILQSNGVLQVFDFTSADLADSDEVSGFGQFDCGIPGTVIGSRLLSDGRTVVASSAGVFVGQSFKYSSFAPIWTSPDGVSAVSICDAQFKYAPASAADPVDISFVVTTTNGCVFVSEVENDDGSRTVAAYYVLAGQGFRCAARWSNWLVVQKLASPDALAYAVDPDTGEIVDFGEEPKSVECVSADSMHEYNGQLYVVDSAGAVKHLTYDEGTDVITVSGTADVSGVTSVWRHCFAKGGKFYGTVQDLLDDSPSFGELADMQDVMCVSESALGATVFYRDADGRLWFYGEASSARQDLTEYVLGMPGELDCALPESGLTLFMSGDALAHNAVFSQYADAGIELKLTHSFDSAEFVSIDTAGRLAVAHCQGQCIRIDLDSMSVSPSGIGYYVTVDGIFCSCDGTEQVIGGKTHTVSVRKVRYFDSDPTSDCFMVVDHDVDGDTVTEMYMSIGQSERRFQPCPTAYSDIGQAWLINSGFAISLARGAMTCLSLGKSYDFIQLDGTGSDDCRGMVKLQDFSYLAYTSNGLYRLAVNSSTAQATAFLLKYGGDYSAACAANPDSTYERVFLASGQKLYAADGISDFSKCVLELDPSAGGINGFLPKSKFTYVVATEAGLYSTSYKYRLAVDNERFTTVSAQVLFETMRTELNELGSAMISSHSAEEHTAGAGANWAETSAVGVDFETAGKSSRFGNLSAWTECSAIGQTAVVRNDLPEYIWAGDQTDGDVMASYSNIVTGWEPKQAELTYICKRYNSGMTEIYVHIPTTETYYLNHVKGCGKCASTGVAMVRKNLAQAGVRQEVRAALSNCTEIDVAVCTSLFGADAGVFDIQIDGNSLPLKIYSDQSFEGSEGASAKLFHSVILPSIVTENGSAISEDGYRHFRFKCFGTDEQSICIGFHDSEKIRRQDTVLIKFSPNGGIGTMPGQRLAEGQVLRVREHSFQKAGYLFVGWSVGSALQDGSSAAAFHDGDAISIDAIRAAGGNIELGQTVIFHAVWSKFEFTKDDTVLVMDGTREPFAIERVKVDGGTDLGDKVIVDFGD